jgi:hypothetical protein
VDLLEFAKLLDAIHLITSIGVLMLGIELLRHKDRLTVLEMQQRQHKDEINELKERTRE